MSKSKKTTASIARKEGGDLASQVASMLSSVPYMENPVEISVHGLSVSRGNQGTVLLKRSPADGTVVFYRPEGLQSLIGLLNGAAKFIQAFDTNAPEVVRWDYD